MRYLLPRIEALPLWPMISGIVFFLLFAWIVVWTFSKRRKKTYEEIEKLPLEDDE